MTMEKTLTTKVRSLEQALRQSERTLQAEGKGKERLLMEAQGLREENALLASRLDQSQAELRAGRERERRREREGTNRAPKAMHPPSENGQRHARGGVGGGEGEAGGSNRSLSVSLSGGVDQSELDSVAAQLQVRTLHTTLSFRRKLAFPALSSSPPSHSPSPPSPFSKWQFLHMSCRH